MGLWCGGRPHGPHGLLRARALWPRWRTGIHGEEGVEGRLAEVELVDVVLREAAHPQPPMALHLA